MRVGRREIKNQWVIAGLGILIVILACITAWNAVNLVTAAKDWTQSYLSDVAEQVAAQADQRIYKAVSGLEHVATRLGAFESVEEQVAFLEEVDGLALFSSMAVVDEEYQAYFQNGERVDMSDNAAVRKVFEEGRQLSIFTLEECVFYAMLIPGQGAERTVLLGVKDKVRMADIVDDMIFNGQGIVFIVEQDGEIVIPPEREEMLRDLRNVFCIDGEVREEQQENLSKIVQDMGAGKNGNVRFQDGNGTVFLMNYTPMEAYEWYVLTCVPEEALYADIEVYIARNSVITGLSIILFMLVLCLMVWIQNQNDEKLERQLFRDRLTGGMSNAKFLLDLANAVGGRPASYYVLLSLDISEFRILNDIYGAENGNRTLRYVYGQLLKHLEEEEFLCRDRADVFYMLLKNRPESEMLDWIRNLQEEINCFPDGRDEVYWLKIHVGIYVIDDKSVDIHVMQGRADIARRSTKEGKQTNCIFYNQVERDRMVVEKELIDLLDSSLQNREFQVYLQPKVRVEDQKVVGAEALIRWNNPVRGFIYPGEFIPVFEKKGLIDKLDLFVFEEVCRLLERWKAEGRELPMISANLSRQHLLKENFEQVLVEILGHYDVDPGLIELEVTESTMFEDVDMIQVIIERIHRAGFGCSIDDFGSGYSSLGILKSLDVDMLKMDRSFFKEEGDGERGRSVVRMIVELARSLNVKSVAEGIETRRQIDFLKTVKCDMIQGYVFSKPLPIDEFEALVYDGKELKNIEAAG